MIKAILVDDEPSNSHILEEILKQYCPSVTVAGTCTNIDLANQLIREQDPHLLFLDIQMPNGSGFDLLDRIKNYKKIEVIFVTAHDQFLLQAIRFSALDYLLKPINIQEVVAAVNRAEERLNAQTITDQLKILLSNIQQPVPAAQKIAIPTMEGYRFIPIADIVRLEAKGSYTEIFLTNNKPVIASKNIKEYEELLPRALFSRVHRTHIINVNFIRAYHKGRGGYVEMENGFCINVSVGKKEEFLTRFR